MISKSILTNKIKLFIFIKSTFIFVTSVIQGNSHSDHSAGTLDTGGLGGDLGQVLVIFGLLLFLVIVISGILLLKRPKSNNPDPKTYVEKINSFRVNARLYIIHIQFMSLTFGVRTVLFNLYILFLFGAGVTVLGMTFDPVLFIGILLAVGAMVSGVVSIFSGIVVDRIGKKWSFILGDFIGAMAIMVLVLVPEPLIIVLLQIIRSGVMSIHNIAEGPFIYEQSTPKERVHLFSVSSGMSTMASMSGNLLGGVVPLAIALFLYQTVIVEGTQTIFVLQIGLVVSVLLWLSSLIPAFFMKEEKLIHNASNMSIKAQMSFKHVKHWSTISVFVLNSVFLGLGAGMFLQFFSIFFLIFIDANVAEIAIIFALGSFTAALGMFGSPLIAERFGKVNSIVGSRLLSIPFLVLLPLSVIIGGVLGLTPVLLGGIFFMIRGIFNRSTFPTEAALAMEVVDDAERTTMEALREAGESIFAGIGFFVGGYFMGIGDFITPFVGAAILYFVAVIIFWMYFRKNRAIEPSVTPVIHQSTSVAT